MASASPILFKEPSVRRKVEPPLYDWFLPGDGISEPVLIRDIKWRLGPRASFQIRFSEGGDKGYIIRASRPFSAAQLKHLRDESWYYYLEAQTEVSLKALAHASAHNEFEEAHRLLQEGVDPNLMTFYQDSVGNTTDVGHAQFPITRALRHGHWSMAEMLIDSAADIDAKNNTGLTILLELSSDNKYATAVQWLLEHGANCEAKTESHGRTPLHLAILSKSSDLVSVLLKGGASPSSMDTMGLCGLHLAIAQNFPEIITILIQSGADIEIDTFHGSKPIHYSVMCRAQESLVCLLDLGAKRDSKNSIGKTALEIASNLEYMDALALLSEPIVDNHLIHCDYQNESEVPFKHIRFLGDGAFAKVDEVRATGRDYTSAGQLFARKYITLPCHSQEQYRKNAEEEVSMLRKLQHCHVIKAVATYYTPSPKAFAIIMSPVARCHLAQFLNLPDVESMENTQLIQQWFGCLATGLHYLHEREIRHKDIKPENILVEGQNILFADFGLSKSCKSESSTSGPLTGCTMRYCAPEVADEDRRGKSSDVFSLGCCYLEMVTILCQESLEEFLTFRANHTSHAYHANMDKVLLWISHLARKIETSNPRKYSDKNADTTGYYWRRLASLGLCFLMLQPNRVNRPKPGNIVALLEKESGNLMGADALLYGMCCQQEFLKLAYRSPSHFRLRDMEPFMRTVTSDWDEANRVFGFNQPIDSPSTIPTGLKGAV